MAGTLVRVLIKRRLSATRLSLSYNRSYFLALLAPGSACKVPLTSCTTAMRLSNSLALIGSYLRLEGHLAVAIKPSVQDRFCQIASVTKGAKGWRVIRSVSRVFLRSGMFL